MSSLDLRGRTFHAPDAVKWGVSEDGEDRLIAAVFTGSPTVVAGHLVTPVFRPGSVDLGLVAAGICPILEEHRFTLDAVLGVVQHAWIEAGDLRLLGRLADTPAATTVWRLMTSGIPLSVSIGYEADAVDLIGETELGNSFSVTALKLLELSIVVRGKNSTAKAQRVFDDDTVAALERKVAATAADPELALRRRLRLDHWTVDWPHDCGARLAGALGVDPDLAGRLLAHEVEQRAAMLLADLAA